MILLTSVSLTGTESGGSRVEGRSGEPNRHSPINNTASGLQMARYVKQKNLTLSCRQ